MASLRSIPKGVLMDLNHLRHFVAIAEEKHFGKAAEKLGISQPPLSRSLRRLEESLGVVLFERSHRAVVLTNAGLILLPQARSLLLQADRLRRTAKKSEMGEIARLEMGVVGTATYELIPTLLAKFHDK